MVARPQLIVTESLRKGLFFLRFYGGEKSLRLR